MKKIILSITILAMTALCLCPLNISDASAKSGKDCHKCCLNKKKLNLIKGESYALKLKGSKGKSSWTSSDKSVATVSKKGKIKAVGKGTCTVKCKNRKKVYKCKVKVDTETGTPVPLQTQPPYTPLVKQPPDYYGGEGCIQNYFIKYEFDNYYKLSDGTSAACDYIINKSSLNGIVTYNGTPISVSELRPGDVLKINFTYPQTCEYPHAINNIISVEVTDRRPEYAQIKYYYDVLRKEGSNICILLGDNEYVISVENEVKKITYGNDANPDGDASVKAGDKIRIVDDSGNDIEPAFFRIKPFIIEVLK